MTHEETQVPKQEPTSGVIRNKYSALQDRPKTNVHIFGIGGSFCHILWGGKTHVMSFHFSNRTTDVPRAELSKLFPMLAADLVGREVKAVASGATTKLLFWCIASLVLACRRMNDAAQGADAQ